MLSLLLGLRFAKYLFSFEKTKLIILRVNGESGCLAPPPSSIYIDRFSKPCLFLLQLQLATSRTTKHNTHLPSQTNSDSPSFLKPRQPLNQKNMGNCCFTSFDSKQVSTAKLVVHDGELQEFSYPVKVSYLLLKYPTCFICNSDEMDFNDVVTAMDEEEVLQPGQLYFALPLSRLKRPLQAEEMAALAVKASSALAKSGGGGGEKCGFRRKQVVLFSGEENGKSCRRVSPEVGGDGGGSEVVRSRSGKSGGGRGKFTTTLSLIPE